MKRFSIVTAKLAGFGKNLLPIYGSSALAAWAYDSTTEVFEVVFHSGVVKRYRVPIPTVIGFMAAKSKGGFYNRNIKFRKESRPSCGEATEGANARGCVQSAPGTKSPNLIVPAASGARPEIHARG